MQQSAAGTDRSSTPREGLAAQSAPFGGARSLVYDLVQPATKVVRPQRRHVISGNAIRMALRLERRRMIHESRVQRCRPGRQARIFAVVLLASVRIRHEPGSGSGNLLKYRGAAIDLSQLFVGREDRQHRMTVRMRAKLRKRLRAEFSHARLIQDRARLPRAIGPGEQDGLEFLDDSVPLQYLHALQAPGDLQCRPSTRVGTAQVTRERDFLRQLECARRSVSSGNRGRNAIPPEPSDIAQTARADEERGGDPRSPKDGRRRGQVVGISIVERDGRQYGAVRPVLVSRSSSSVTIWQ